MYQSRLVELGHNTSVNKASLKQTIFAHFEDLGIEDQSDSDKRVNVFPKGLQAVLKLALKIAIIKKKPSFLQRLQKLSGKNCSMRRLLSLTELSLTIAKMS